MVIVDVSNSCWRIILQGLQVLWDGWMLLIALNEDGSVTELYDQDYIHNGKKLINPLDRPVEIFQLGGDSCALDHIGLVYNRFIFDEYGLIQEDVKRQECQNWGSVQSKLKIAQDVH
jgi:hypothetical protein